MYTKEGVLINTFVKDEMWNIRDTLVISDSVQLPEMKKEQPKEKSILPVAAAALGVMGVIALAAAFVKHNTRINTSIAPEKRCPTVTRNVVLNEETHQALYQAVTNPNQKTILALGGVLTLSTLAFMGKTFFDGFRDIWVKRKEADIQKNLQEQLIGIETRSFAGKIQITRSMLSEKAKEFNNYMLSFGESIKPSPQPLSQRERGNDVPVFLLGIGVTAGIIGLGFLALRNLGKSKEFIQKYESKTQDLIEDIVKKAGKTPTDTEIADLDYYLQSVNASPEYVKEVFGKTNWANKDKEAANIIKKITSSTTQVDRAMGGNAVPKPTFYSHVNDYRAFCYNYLLDTDNKQFRQLFFGITGLTAFSYGGKLVGDALKDVQVKKINAQTEANLQNRLVSTELRNFKSKKDAAIQPLVEEFYKQANSAKPKEELKTMADNILFEIKNGPPFV
jgi:hypothetical protein